MAGFAWEFFVWEAQAQAFQVSHAGSSGLSEFLESLHRLISGYLLWASVSGLGGKRGENPMMCVGYLKIPYILGVGLLVGFGRLSIKTLLEPLTFGLVAPAS